MASHLRFSVHTESDPPHRWQLARLDGGVRGGGNRYTGLGIRSATTVLAFLLGFFVAGFLGAIWYVVATFTGASSWMVGALAERWTAKELLALGPRWKLFNNIPFIEQGFDGNTWEIDVDHVAVGPYGVLVV